jgi:hypothetical protein
VSFSLLLLTLAAASDFFVVRVADEATGHGVPLIELKLPNEVRYYTDSAGIAAIQEPGMEGRQVFVEVSGHGYQYPAETVMGRGLVLTLKSGARADVKVKRTMIGERLYRLTGDGIYRDSVLAGLQVPIAPANGQVLGQDTAVMVPYAGKLFWIWGDTTGTAYWNFSVTAATSERDDDPSVGIRYRYFAGPDDRVRKMLPLKDKGLVWIEGLFTVRNPQGAERLLATYPRQDGLKKPDECGVAIYEDARQVFEPWTRLPCQKESHYSSHPIRFEGYWYLYPWLRVPDQWDAIRDPGKWERREVQLPPEAKRVSSVAWNEYRKKFVLLMERVGEVWYAEGARPEGPYGRAVRIVQHDHYNFYNVVRHPFFDREGGRTIYFEGTYTAAFSDAKTKTPRYDYNQILFRLRLDDPRLADAQR